MKRCPSCGAELKDSATFCFVCGMPAGGGAVSEKEAERMRREIRTETHVRKKSHVGRTVFLAFLAALVLLAVGYAWFSPALRTLREIRMGNLRTAEETYRKEVRPTVLEMFAVRTLAPLTADQILYDYNHERTGYALASEGLSLLKDAEYPANRTASRIDRLASLETSKRSWFRGKELENEGRYEEAMAGYASVSEDDIHYDSAQEKASAMARKYKREILRETSAPSTERAYERAIEVVEAARKVLPQDQDFSDRLSALKQQYSSQMKTETLDTAKRYISKGYYKQAISMIEKAMTYNENDMELQTLLTTAQNDYEDFAKDQVAVYLENNDYDGAMKLMERVRADMPDDAVIDQLYRTTEASKSLYQS